MRRIVIAALAYLALISAGQAQFNSPAMTAVLDSGRKPAYTGTGDVITTNWKAWFGFRAFTSATRGNKLMNVCDSTGGVDVTCVDMFSSPVTGYLVVTSPGGVGCAANCTVKTLYDQSGALFCAGSACDVTRATVAGRATLVPNCLNGFACAQGGGNAYASAAVMGTLAQPMSQSGIGKRTANFTTILDIITDGSGNVQIGFSNVANNAIIFAGTIVSVAGVNDNVTHAINATFNGASTIYNIDGATATVNSGTQVSSGLVAAVSNGVGMNFSEGGINSGNLSAGNLVSLNTNMHAAYGGF